MSGAYDQAKRFLLAARPNNTDDAGSQFRRRIPVAPYAVLEGPISLAMGGGDDDGDDGGGGGGGGGGCQYNLSEITASTCAQLDVLVGTPTCDPPFLVTPVDVSFEPFVVAWTGNTSFSCGSVYSFIYDIPGGELGSAGVWAGGTQLSESVSAAVSYTNASLFQYGILLANVAITFVSGTLLLMEISADGTQARVLYGGDEVIPWTMLLEPITPGTVGVHGASKGHQQTFGVQDCRCA